MRYGIASGLLAVILAISPGVVAQEETPSPAPKASTEAGPSAGRTTSPEKTKTDRPRGKSDRFKQFSGGDEELPSDLGAFPIQEMEGPMDYQDVAEGAPAPAGTTTMEYLTAVGILALAFAVVTAAAVMRVRRVLSADAAFKLIALTLIVVAGLSLLRSEYAPELMAPMMVVLGTALGFIFGKPMGSTAAEEAHRETPPIVPPPV